MNRSSGSDSVGAGTLNSAAGKRKADDITNVEDPDPEALADVSEETEDFTSLKRQRLGRGLKR